MRWLKNLSIRKKLISYMLFFTVIPITLITSVALGITHRTVKDQLIYNHRVSSGWLQDRLNLELQDAMNQIYGFEVDKDVRNDILTWCNTDRELGYSERWTLISAMNSVISMDNTINSIELYSLSKDEVLIAQRDGATMEKTKDRLDFWLERDDSLQTNLVYIQNGDEILEVHGIHRFEDNELIALMVIHLRPYEIQKILSDIKSVPEESILILNDQNNLIEADYGSNWKTDETTVEKVRGLLGASSQKEIIYEEQFWFYRTVRNGKIQLLVAVPEKTISDALLPTLFIGVCVAMIAGIASIICAIVFSAVLSKPIQQLSFEMQKLELNNYKDSQIRERTDEIGVLQKSFDIMITRNRELIEQEYKAKIEKRSAQLRALQAQINPHFMYNTLQVIGGMALKHNAPEIYRITVALSDIMRYSLNFLKEMVPLSEEVAYLKSYVMIQNERFGGRIQLVLQLQEETLKCLVPKLILQPLAENTFEYGFSEITGDSKILVESMFTKENDLFVRVTDNGLGFTSERLKEIRGTLQRDAENSLKLNSHIGLSNVHTRIRLSSNSDKYGLSIESTRYRGTEISILLRKIFETER
ncbi:MAG: two-component system, sensor histidine kinase YesM [Clostridiales bacterium]|nr:two-component system, sensor histidine kinase YesM [Clostridiales bacterium]